MLSNEGMGKILTTKAINFRKKSENEVLKDKRIHRIVEAASWTGGESLETANSYSVNINSK